MGNCRRNISTNEVKKAETVHNANTLILAAKERIMLIVTDEMSRMTDHRTGKRQVVVGIRGNHRDDVGWSYSNKNS